MIVAIDGPSASGKTTTAKSLAKKLGYIHLNSGLMYRAVTYIFLSNDLIDNLPNCINSYFENINLQFLGTNMNKVLYNNVNITSELFSEEVTASINRISNNSKIRKNLVCMQKTLVYGKNVVCEGRDIGTAVFPDAKFKFYLNADIKSRVIRRFNQLDRKISKKDIEQKIINRDYYDMTRKNSPLKRAANSIEVDTTNLTIEEQVNVLYKMIKNGKYNG